MAPRLVAVVIAVAFYSTAFFGNGFAASDLVVRLQANLYAGRTAQAAADVRARLAVAPEDAGARFALGAVEFLQAVEHLGQGLHRYGLKSDYRDAVGLTGLPFLRLPVPPNDNPEKATYEALRGLLADFARKLAAAEVTLDAVGAEEIDVPLNIGLIRLDLDGDGQGGDHEALWQMFAAVADADWLDAEEAEKLVVDFDGSDVPWLRAYCHLLMAIAEFPLAYDWRETFEATFHGVFPQAGLPMSAVLSERTPSLEPLSEERLRRERERQEYGGIADLIAFVHLSHWVVVEPQRLVDVLDNLQAMVRLSRDNWERILAETDDRNEWIPSPKQTGALPRMAVSPGQVRGWHQFLDEFDDLLAGRKLLPHWRFDNGVNLRRFFLEPRTFDIVLLIQGSGALPYLEDGTLTSEDTWDQILRLFEGDFFRYLVWFN